ncbi:MAG: YqeG family HAD IIIA-type phosphatase [Oscillospiraceae bacterium]|nr:YqeG family HAD IIIA-type phosphatase [Oscillospiraceae bacterium]
MRFPLLPMWKVDSITELTPAILEEKGIRLLMLDFDNTIVPYATNAPTREMAAWLQTMTDSSVEICVVSNSKKNRVKIFCDQYGIPCITHAKKPGTKGIRECLSRYGLPKENCALAGDQIYTDVLGGNSAGVQSILVKAIHNHNFWLKARGVLELPWRAAACKRRIAP